MHSMTQMQSSSALFIFCFYVKTSERGVPQLITIAMPRTWSEHFKVSHSGAIRGKSNIY